MQAAEEALPSIISIMAEELHWSDEEKTRQHDAAMEFLQTEMGQNVNRQSRDKIPINLSREEIAGYIKRFQSLDKERKGYVSLNDIRRSLKVYQIIIPFYNHNKLFRQFQIGRSLHLGPINDDLITNLEKKNI